MSADQSAQATTDVTIRAALPEEAAALQAIACRAMDAGYRGFLGDKAVDYYLESGAADREIARGMGHAMVAVTGGAATGFSVVLDDLLHLLIVDPPAQRRGLGAALLGAAETAIAQAGHATARLEIHAGNTAASAFYAAHGWQEAGYLADPDGFARRLRMEKHL
ncbi:GNAT family N-acetyltransferase [Pseudoruegeria sp. SHC-113]|uniref:GNAT family N-acetyltransferase n=1 Tax=Pseudoruegeria sp. SHC-113 TaxID=2855439 RepID=UPI0021BA85FF|nr:GNAT family N-acetyltransferase [Pseudoruegeria sp. SHC-113]MCT8161963.1 GNAT family N-acetyltransferase [Pseudoruegeria sp. SHC-113]